MKLCRNIAWTLPWRFRRKELFHLCLSLAHLLTLCHIEATSRRKGSTRTDTPALQGYHRPPPPPTPATTKVWHCWWDHFVVHTYCKPRVKLWPWRPLKSTPMACIANVEIWPKLYRFEPKLMTPCFQKVFRYIYIK